MNLLGSRKGQARDYITAIVFLFVLGFVVIFCYMLLSRFMVGFASGPIWTPEMDSTANSFLGALRIMDYIMVIVMVLLIAGVGYSSYRINSRPIFFIITILSTPFLGFLSFFFNYVFSSLVSDATLNAALAYFHLTLLICTNLHWVMLILIVVGSITYFGKRNQEVAL